jgi:Rrf2 family transcriptional repressor of oqxAB
MDETAKGTAVGPTWFAVAIRALAMLAAQDGTCPSAAIAGKVKTHAVFLRRVLAQLARAGIVEAREGRDGGYRLLRPADGISLGDVYEAVSAANSFSASPVHLDTTCPGDAAMHRALAEVIQEAEQRVIEVLRRRTVADVMHRATDLYIAP